jgi:hypothetical protein
MSLLSLDYKIKEWEDENERIFEQLKKRDNIIYINKFEHNRCYTRDLFEFKYQKCGRCKYLYNHLLYHSENNSHCIIPSGKRKGRKMEIVSEKGTDQYFLVEEAGVKNNTIGRKIFDFYKDEFFCITNVNYYSTRDILTNISIILLILRLYSIKKNFPLYIDFIYFYNCTDTNFLIYLSQEFESIEEFNLDPNYNNSFSPIAQKRKVSEFSFDTVKDIIFQTVITLKFYGNLFFTHNELDYTKLRFSSKPIHVQYDKKIYISPFRCFIFPSAYSSICVYNSKEKWWNRFFHQKTQFSKDERFEIPFEDVLFEMNGTKNYYNHDIVNISQYISSPENYLQHRIFFYRLNNKMNYFLKLRRTNGSVFLLNSFDIITLLCSLMTLPYFYDSLLKNSDLSRIWYGLWRKSEGQKITQLLINQHHPLKFDDVCLIIKKFYIRFDGLEYLYRELDNL